MNIHVTDLHHFQRFGHLKTIYAIPYIRKQLAEPLVLSKLDYCNVLYDSIPAYLIRVQNCAARFVLGRYHSAEDIQDLKWLQVIESIELNIAKLAFKTIYNKNSATYLPTYLPTFL